MASVPLSASGNPVETKENWLLDAMASVSRFAGDEIHKLGIPSRGSCSTHQLCPILVLAPSFCPCLASLSLTFFRLQPLSNLSSQERSN
jgi:hypothetical protein